MNRIELMRKFRLTCANIQWSWVFHDPIERDVVFQRFKQNGNVIYDPAWNKGTSTAGQNEMIAMIDKVMNDGYTAYIVEANGHVQDGRFKLDNYGKSLFEVDIKWNKEKLVYTFKQKD